MRFFIAAVSFLAVSFHFFVFFESIWKQEGDDEMQTRYHCIHKRSSQTSYESMP